MVRIAWQAGEGLGPLRFSDLLVAQDCSSAPDCELEFMGHSIRLFVEAEQPEAWISDISSNQAPIALHLDQITRANGISLVLTKTGFQPKQKPDCGSRAWRICRAIE